MPCFGCNRFTIPFIEAVLEKEVLVSGGGVDGDGNEIPPVYNSIGFRLSDRIVSAVDRLLDQLIGRFASVTYPGLSRFAFIYPFVGGLDWSHSMNLADEEGGYSKYEILWIPGTGTVTHSANGITLTGNAVGNTQAECGWNTGENLENWVYKTFGAYSRTNNSSGGAVMAASKTQGTTNYYQHIYPRQSDGNYYVYQVYTTTSGTGGGVQTIVAVADSLGLFMASREHSTLLRCFKRAVQVTYNNTVATPGLGTGTGGGVMNILGTRNLAFVFSTKHNAFLSYTECLAFEPMIQRFQTALLRQV